MLIPYCLNLNLEYYSLYILSFKIFEFIVMYIRKITYTTTYATTRNSSVID